MKYALSALFGSLVSTVAVVLAGHSPALLVGLGFVTAVLLYTWVLRLIGRERLIRLLTRGRLERLQREAHNLDHVGSNPIPATISNAGAGHPVKQGTGHLGKLFGGVSRTSASSGQQHFSNRTGKSETISRATVRAVERLRRTRPVGIVLRGAVAPRQPSGPEGWSNRDASERERGKVASNARQPRRAPTYNQTVLRPVQQDVLSALMNLGCSFRQAEEAVQSVTDRPGESFDQLFRKALDAVNSGKMLTRKAVA